MRIGYLFNLIFNLAYAGLNLFFLYSYFSSPKVSEAYGYRYVFIYLLFPLVVVSILIIVSIQKYLISNKNLKTILYTLVLFNIPSTFGYDYLLQKDVNKIKVIINNMTTETLDSVKILGRNSQEIDVGNIHSGQSKQVYCDCRDVDIYSNDTIGLLVRYRLNNKIENLYIVGSNENLFDEYKEIKIISDSLKFQSFDYGNEILWGRIDFSDGLFPWDTISERIDENKYYNK